MGKDHSDVNDEVVSLLVLFRKKNGIASEFDVVPFFFDLCLGLLFFEIWMHGVLKFLIFVSGKKNYYG